MKTVFDVPGLRVRMASDEAADGAPGVRVDIEAGDAGCRFSIPLAALGECASLLSHVQTALAEEAEHYGQRAGIVQGLSADLNSRVTITNIEAPFEDAHASVTVTDSVSVPAHFQTLTTISDPVAPSDRRQA